MATKKQKREAGFQKHLRESEDLRRSGLEAQRKDRETRTKKEREAWQENHDKKHSWKNLVKECPLCQDKMKHSKSSKKVYNLPSSLKDRDSESIKENSNG